MQFSPLCGLSCLHFCQDGQSQPFWKVRCLEQYTSWKVRVPDFVYRYRYSYTYTYTYTYTYKYMYTCKNVYVCVFVFFFFVVVWCRGVVWCGVSGAKDKESEEFFLASYDEYIATERSMIEQKNWVRFKVFCQDWS